jgi:hypothetical protein
MNCPYCHRLIYGMTGLQEAMKFERHLKSCRKNPNNAVIRDGKRSAATPIRHQGLMDALKIREASGQ